MTNDAWPIEMWELPGPHGWVRRLARELDGGKSCLVVMPDGASKDPHLLGVVEALAAQTRAESVPAIPGRTMIDAIIDHLDDGTYPGGNNPFRALATWDVLAGHTLIIRAWEHHDPDAVDQFATRWPAALHEAGPVPEERPRLILVCRPQDAGPADLYRTDGLNLVVRWWWAALGRLDTDVVVSMTADCLGPIERAIVSELAGWNLEGAVALGKAWDGLLSSLEDAINGTFAADRDTFSRQVTSKRPPKDLLAVWSSRRVDVWDRRIQGTAGRATPEQIQAAVWSAQSRIVLPHLESERAGLERTVREKGSTVANAALDSAQRADGVVEFSHIKAVVRDHPALLTEAQRLVLRSCVATRNALAHVSPAPAEDLHRLSTRWGLEGGVG